MGRGSSIGSHLIHGPIKVSTVVPQRTLALDRRMEQSCLALSGLRGVMYLWLSRTTRTLVLPMANMGSPFAE